MKVRLAQMRTPNVSFGPLDTGDKPHIPFGFCDIDQKRSRTVNLKDQPRDPEHLDGSSYAEAADKNYASQATHHRRAYGRRTKVSVYQMVGQRDKPLPDFRPALEFEEIGHRDSWRAEGDRNESDRYAAAKDKMAVLYFDGNRFGKLLRALPNSARAYHAADEELRELRKKLMRAFIDGKEGEPGWTGIRNKPYWKVKPGGPDSRHDEKVRIETLLWGGDEWIWVVPAWCGLEAVQFFFRHTARPEWQLQEKQLTHAVGIVICSCKSPIRSVVALAHELADNVKTHLDDLGREFCREASVGTKDSAYQPCANALAYEVLESFDHLGRDFQEARRELRFPPMSETDAILTAEGLDKLVQQVTLLKHGRGDGPNGPRTPKLPQRRLHQIAQVFHRRPFAIPADAKPEEWPDKIGQTAYGRLIQRIAQTASGRRERADYVKTLNDTLHWPTPDKLPAVWFHVLELWNYTGYRALDSASDQGEAWLPQEARP